jgi:hypothetical protein
MKKKMLNNKEVAFKNLSQACNLRPFSEPLCVNNGHVTPLLKCHQNQKLIL